MMPNCELPNPYVYQIDQEQKELLKKNFFSIYQCTVDFHYVANAQVQKADGLDRYFSGFPVPNFNAVVGCIEDPEELDARIEEERKFFGTTPFFWYVDVEASGDFKEALKRHGFIDAGILQGVIGKIDPTLCYATIPEDCVLEKVQDEKEMREFSELVCEVFGVEDSLKEPFQQMQWHFMHTENPKWVHWVVRKQGRVVSAVSTMTQNGLVSFSNGATLPEFRKAGLNTALRYAALHEAMEQGAKFGSSFLAPDGLAFGICTKLGYQTKWRFHAFVAPS